MMWVIDWPDNRTISDFTKHVLQYQNNLLRNTVKKLPQADGQGASSIQFICDDTKVFFVLMFVYWKHNLDWSVVIESPIAGISLCYIKASTNKPQQTNTMIGG